MTYHGGLRLELADGIKVVRRYLLDALVGEDFGVFLCLVHGIRVIRPTRS